jgi:hypothetical protein
MPGASHVNYCDLVLDDYAPAYWAATSNRLRKIKRKFDPTSVFHHAQSVPVKCPGRIRRRTNLTPSGEGELYV